MDGVVLITGIMAAGKSTVAQALAERLPRAAHVRGDVFRRMVVSGRAEYGPGAAPGSEAEAQLRLRYRLSAATADAYARAGFTAVVQDVVLGGNLTEYTGLVRTRPLYVVVLAPRAEAVAEREAGRAKTGYGAWTVGELDRGLRADTPRVGLWLDTSGQTVEQTVDAIVAGREQARIR
ncbi:AAA family ATPase [Streptomyces beigongshangae]|uniref:AAA family ATPase n=1 Tax=Streptomyces beigongshangae TaxID=2841597 RepID=UPI001C84F14A|nr:AAA family ATPase [Streptomyces sp. REN17]